MGGPLEGQGRAAGAGGATGQGAPFLPATHGTRPPGGDGRPPHSPRSYLARLLSERRRGKGEAGLASARVAERNARGGDSQCGAGRCNRPPSERQGLRRLLRCCPLRKGRGLGPGRLGGCGVGGGRRPCPRRPCPPSRSPPPRTLLLPARCASQVDAPALSLQHDAPLGYPNGAPPHLPPPPHPPKTATGSGGVQRGLVWSGGGGEGGRTPPARAAAWQRRCGGTFASRGGGAPPERGRRGQRRAL